MRNGFYIKELKIDKYKLNHSDNEYVEMSYEYSFKNIINSDFFIGRDSNVSRVPFSFSDASN